MDFLSSPYRPAQRALFPQGPTITDDYERWYTEPAPNNRMLLSIRSGIDSEISWALDRLCRLCDNEQFLFKSIPGLANALFEWPEWYVSDSQPDDSQLFPLFSMSVGLEQKRRHALESLFILRNASIHEANAQELSNHPRTLPLILSALQKLKPDSDANVEFLLHVVEMLQVVAPDLVLPSPSSLDFNPVCALQEIAGHSSNRSLIIASLSALNVILSNPLNSKAVAPDCPALSAAIRYLPLVTDNQLIDACVNYLYTYLSQFSMAKTFLLHPDMPGTLRLLVGILLSEQTTETVTLDISGPVRTASTGTVTSRDYELSADELKRLDAMAEPHRCYEWMRTMFVPNPEGELTQVEFWNLYRASHGNRTPGVSAAEVIRNVTTVYPTAQAMVAPGPPQRFVVRGVDRRKEDRSKERFKCQWERCLCQAPCGDGTDLYEHIIAQHVQSYENDVMPCLWMSCDVPSMPKPRLRAHIFTHIPSTQTLARYEGQEDSVTLSSEMEQYPMQDPTSRPPPPLRSTIIIYQKPSADAPPTSLTALLCIRILFKTAFVSQEAAPRVDKNHFGFPGIVEDEEEQEVIEDGTRERERKGQRLGRRAFEKVRGLMERVQLKDETLMGWMLEMIDETAMSLG